MREGDLVARLGGDEFAVLATGNAHDQGFIALAALEQNIDQPFQRLRIVTALAQYLTIVALCIIELTLPGLDISQGKAGVRPVRGQAQGLADQGLCLGCLAFGLGVPSLLQCKPVADFLQSCLPLAAVTLSCGLTQEFFRFVQSVLLLADNPKATQRVSILGPGVQARLKSLFGRDLVTFFECLEAARHFSGRLPALVVCRAQPLLALVHLRADFQVIRMSLEVGLEQRQLRGIGRADPGQRQAPAFVCITGDVGTLGQPGQGADALGTAVFMAYQMLGVKQRDDRVVRHFALQALKSASRFRPVGLIEGKVVVVLAADLALRWTAIEQLAKHGGRFVAFAGIDEAASLFQTLLVLRLCQGYILCQLQCQAR